MSRVLRVLSAVRPSVSEAWRFFRAKPRTLYITFSLFVPFFPHDRVITRSDVRLLPKDQKVFFLRDLNLRDDLKKCRGEYHQIYKNLAKEKFGK